MGSIPFGLVVGKVFYGVDVRQHGSGNVGTTNVFRVLGKKAGVVVLVCDMLKGYIPAAIAAALFTRGPRSSSPPRPVVGHMYSIFLKGRGGKGIATGAGVVLALVPLAFVIIFVAWIVLILATRYVSVASLAAALPGARAHHLPRTSRCRTRSPACWCRSSCGGRIAATSSGCWPARSTASGCRGRRRGRRGRRTGGGS